MKIVLKDIKDTVNIAKQIAPKLVGGDILLLKGDLGVGKTTFTKALCEALGVKEMVTSPTFTIMNEYNGRVRINHLDMYRVNSVGEAREFGFDEILRDTDAINIIEWPEVVEDILPNEVIEITITRIDEYAREMEIKGVEV